MHADFQIADRREFIKISQAVGVGFLVMGAVGYLVKLSRWLISLYLLLLALGSVFPFAAFSPYPSLLLCLLTSLNQSIFRLIIS